MGKFRSWYLTYNSEITWFIVGLLFGSFLDHLAKGRLDLALLDAGIAGINIYFWKVDYVR